MNILGAGGAGTHLKHLVGLRRALAPSVRTGPESEPLLTSDLWEDVP